MYWRNSLRKRRYYDTNATSMVYSLYYMYYVPGSTVTVSWSRSECSLSTCLPALSERKRNLRAIGILIDVSLIALITWNRQRWANKLTDKIDSVEATLNILFWTSTLISRILTFDRWSVTSHIACEKNNASPTCLESNYCLLFDFDTSSSWTQFVPDDRWISQLLSFSAHFRFVCFAHFSHFNEHHFSLM